MRNSAHRPVAHVNALGGNAVTGRMGAGEHNCSRPTCEREKRMFRTVLLTRALGVASGVLIFAASNEVEKMNIAPGQPWGFFSEPFGGLWVAVDASHQGNDSKKFK